MKNYKLKYLLGVTFLMLLVLGSCTTDPNDPGLEFAPQMYVSKPYEPYSQVAGVKNQFNSMGMNLRHPAPNTIARRNFNTSFEEGEDFMLYNLKPGPEGLEEAQSLTNPLPLNKQILDEGKVLYERYCQACHGAKGDGQGKVGQKYAGVANYAGITKNNGHIFHVITFGKNRMWPHGSQVNPDERWKIVYYVNKLQYELNGEEMPMTKQETSEEGEEAEEEEVEGTEEQAEEETTEAEQE